MMRSPSSAQPAFAQHAPGKQALSALVEAVFSALTVELGTDPDATSA
jgi:hypothetical protein